MQVGPILKETLTRFVYILTNQRCRCFSLGSGQEIIMKEKLFETISKATNSRNISKFKKEIFPLSNENIIKTFPSFSYHLCALCPLQRMIVFGSPQESRLAGK